MVLGRGQRRTTSLKPLESSLVGDGQQKEGEAGKERLPPVFEEVLFPFSILNRRKDHLLSFKGEKLIETINFINEAILLWDFPKIPDNISCSKRKGRKQQKNESNNNKAEEGYCFSDPIHHKYQVKLIFYYT
jgi:hypothetical protein